MPKPSRTIKTFLSMAASMQTICHLKGYEALSDSDKSELHELTAMISNQIGELSPELQNFCAEAEQIADDSF